MGGVCKEERSVHRSSFSEGPMTSESLVMGRKRSSSWHGSFTPLGDSGSSKAGTGSWESLPLEKVLVGVPPDIPAERRQSSPGGYEEQRGGSKPTNSSAGESSLSSSGDVQDSDKQKGVGSTPKQTGNGAAQHVF